MDRALRRVEMDEAEELAQEVLNPRTPAYGGEDAEEQKELDEALLAEFKRQVAAWVDLDVEIKRLQIAVRSRREKQGALSESIMDFMSEYEIDDLNTRYGTLRYKTGSHKKPVKPSVVRSKLESAFADSPDALAVVQRAFEERETVEVTSLRRLGV